MTTFANLYPDSPYITAFDLMNLGPVKLTIDRVDSNANGVEVLGRKQFKPLVYFKGAKKPWLAPKTKLGEVRMKYAPKAKNVEELAGVTIYLYANPTGKNPGCPGGKGPSVDVWMGEIPKEGAAQ